jgi:hypothetical protein
MNVKYLEGTHKDNNDLYHIACQEPAPILHSTTQALQGPVQHQLGIHTFHAFSNLVQPLLDSRLAGKCVLSYGDDANASFPEPPSENATPARELIITVWLRQWRSGYPETSS